VPPHQIDKRGRFTLMEAFDFKRLMTVLITFCRFCTVCEIEMQCVVPEFKIKAVPGTSLGVEKSGTSSKVPDC
jgi:hypothetical protein